jgi:hypothetical protein
MEKKRGHAPNVPADPSGGWTAGLRSLLEIAWQRHSVPGKWAGLRALPAKGGHRSDLGTVYSRFLKLKVFHGRIRRHRQHGTFL